MMMNSIRNRNTSPTRRLSSAGKYSKNDEEVSTWIERRDDDESHDLRREGGDDEREGESPQVMSKILFEAINDYNENSLSSFDLVAGNTFVSNAVRNVMSSMLCNSYCNGTPGSRLFGGCEEIDRIEIMTKDLICHMFKCNYCEVQLLSGMLANIAAYHAMLPETGAVVMACSAKHGGHYSHNRGGPLTRFFGATVVETPWVSNTYNVDIEKLDEAMGKDKPHLLILGWSEILFEYDLPTIRKVCDKHHCKLMYDMSHVAGLIAGGVFQPDVMCYADIVTSSTGKSLHSADHGIILYNDQTLTPKIREAVMPLLTSNTHFHETAALAMTMMEWKEFGNSYAKQVVANTKALSAALSRRGFTVLCEENDYSNTHQILVSLEMNGKVIMSGQEATLKLDKANIRTNPQELPTDTGESGATGLRFGTQVLTRRGFKEADMILVADAIYEALVDTTCDSDLEAISNKVASIARNFKKVHYSFDDEVQEPDSTIITNARAPTMIE